MKSIKLLFFLLIISSIPLSLKAQQVNTLYFMEDIPVRHFLNPSFQPTTDYYLSLPVIGFTQFGIGNNSLTFSDVAYKVHGKTVTFLDSLGNIPRFYNTLKNNTLLHTDFQVNLLSFGFRHESAYWTFSLTEKMDDEMNLPKDVFQISLFGTPNPLNNYFDFIKLEGNLSMYTEIALGYSKQLNRKWVIGGKLKFLAGYANLSNNNQQLSLEAGIEKWNLQGRGVANYSGPVQVKATNDFQSFSYVTPSTVSGWLKPAGIGAGIDMGFTYSLNEKIKLSGAINDLGFIRWSRNTQNAQYGVDFTFNGIKSFNSNTAFSSLQNLYDQLVRKNVLVDSLTKSFRSSTRYTSTTKPYTTATTAKINLGFEYRLWMDKLSFGMLSYSHFFRNILMQELTASVNARPWKWLDASMSYSVFNGGMNTIGAGLGIKTGIFHWFLAADYIPFQKTTLLLSDLGTNYPKIDIPIPYNSKCFNVSAGMNLVFNKKPRVNKGLHSSNKKQDCNCDWK